VAFVSKLGARIRPPAWSARTAERAHDRRLHEHAWMMELIAINIGKDLGLLPTDVFSMLVIMALVSTFIAHRSSGGR
jgi:hypothetical protein